MTIIRLVFCALLLFLSSCMEGQDLSPGVTKAGIRKLQLGMADTEVIALLGPPFERRAALGAPKTEFLFYSRPLRSGHAHPTLTIVLEEGRLASAGAKRALWGGFDDEGVFSLTRDRASAWESPHFESTFPR